MHSLPLSCSGPFHLIGKTFLSSPCLLSCSNSCCQMKTTADKKQVDCVRHKAARIATREEKSYVFMGTGGSDRLDRKQIQKGSSALFTERRGFQFPGFSFLQNFCSKILQKDLIFGQPTTLYFAASQTQVLICSQD